MGNTTKCKVWAPVQSFLLSSKPADCVRVDSLPHSEDNILFSDLNRVVTHSLGSRQKSVSLEINCVAQRNASILFVRNMFWTNS